VLGDTWLLSPIRFFIRQYFRLHSLRARYVFGAALLSVLFILSVWSTQVFLSDAISDTTENTLNRNQIIDLHRNIRNNLRQAEYTLQSYLVSPEKIEYKSALQFIDAAIQQVNKIKNTSWVSGSTKDEQLNILAEALKQYKDHAIELMAIRTNAEKLFPAYNTINNIMLPQNQQMITQIALAEDELSPRLAEDYILDTYHSLNSLKDEWMSMIGLFRMYVASRAMSLDEADNDFSDTEVSIDAHYKSALKYISKLDYLRSNYDLGFQAEISIDELSSILAIWHQAYKNTVLIYAGKNWRMDELVMSEKILPVNEFIWQQLYGLELMLAESSQNDVNRLADVTSNVNTLLWLRVIVALFFIATAFFAFEYWLLRPVALISRALKIEANGFKVDKLPTANTLEAKELIEAFDEMRQQVQIRQLELEHQAMHDSLTGLPNRVLLRKSLEMNIKFARENKTELALLMIDLDRFKEINDTLGHHMGDRVLREIGPRFRRELGENDLLARLGGDEFAILLADTNAEKVNDLAVRLSKTLDADFYLDGQRLWVGSSIGIALYPQHGVNEQALLQRADVAMYLAKHKNLRYAIYDESQDEHSVWQLSFEGELHQVIDNNELVLNYQPKIDLTSGTIYGVEALLRWHHKQHGLIPAEEVHLLAEKTGLIKPLTEWVIRTVIEQLSSWAKQGIELSISANLSVWNLQDPKLFGVVKGLLREFNVPANRLILEITESAVMSDPDSAMDTMNKLSQLGVQLSIDDFGVGFSSLQYLKKLPVKELKIDKTFVMDMIVDDNDALIVKSTIELAHNLGLSVIAEGVESEDIMNKLKSWGCDCCQGYHVSHAIPLEELDDWIKVSVWGLKDKARLQLIS